uniref:Large ribosomal subunit protein bL20c n=1 Tax=Schizaea pectinata TaxID=148576 RepID=A0A286QHM1_9MONI|nr:ribosomal protein L20 [Schizaea pectinata]APT66100.1 ribosomal protein L20 [Schizaea pectinata]
MTRVRRGSVAREHHENIIKMASGSVGAHSRLFRTANQQRAKAFFHAYQDRRIKKREIRCLWITRINAAARRNGTNHSNSINYLYSNQIYLNRKAPGQMVISDTDGFSALLR